MREMMVIISLKPSDLVTYIQTQKPSCFSVLYESLSHVSMRHGLWRHIRLCDAQDPTLSGQSAHRWR